MLRCGAPASTWRDTSSARWRQRPPPGQGLLSGLKASFDGRLLSGLGAPAARAPTCSSKTGAEVSAAVSSTSASALDKALLRVSGVAQDPRDAADGLVLTITGKPGCGLREETCVYGACVRLRYNCQEPSFPRQGRVRCCSSCLSFKKRRFLLRPGELSDSSQETAPTSKPGCGSMDSGQGRHIKDQEPRFDPGKPWCEVCSLYCQVVEALEARHTWGAGFGDISESTV